jgi:hypothetical protein
MRITNNFTLEEFTLSETADKLGINNLPNQEQFDNIKFMAEQLQLVRNAYKQPIYITSGFRCEELNNAVKGSKTSFHRLGLAVDINQGSRAKNKHLFELIKSLMKVGLLVDQLINEQNYSWIHIGFKQENPRLQILKL